MTIDEKIFDQFAAQFGLFKRKIERERKAESNLGATIWDFFMRLDKELLELIQSLESTDGFRDFDKYLKRHTQIVTYLTQSQKFGLIDAGDLNVSDIERYGVFNCRYVKAEPLINRISYGESRSEEIKTKKGMIAAFLRDYKTSLLYDRDLDPDLVESKLEDKVLISNAHSEFIAEFGSRGAEQRQLNEIKALLPEPTDKVSGLNLMVQKYHMGIFILNAIDNVIGRISYDLTQLKKDLSEYELTPIQLADLEQFKRGLHPIYNSGRYLNNYHRILFANVNQFFKGLHDMGITTVIIV